MTPVDTRGSLVEIVDGIYAWLQPDGTWWLNNAGAVHQGDAVLLVDTCATKDRTHALLRAVADATGGATVRWAVNTHQHGDHTYGNALLPGSTVLAGQRKMRSGLRDDFIFDSCPPFWTPTPEWGVPDRRLPDVTFESTLTLHLGDTAIDLHHPGYTAHTTGDTIVHIPDQQVLFVGDLLFNGLTPMILMGSVVGARKSLEWIASFDATHVVPGHGPVIEASDLDRVLTEHDRYYQLIAAAAADGRARGLTPLQAAAQCDLGGFADWPDAERLVLNLHRAYADDDGAEVDLIAAMTDATTWNGGPMRTGV